MSEFRGEMKTLVQTYVELLYPDDLEMQTALFENITTGKASVTLEEMQDYVATRSSWYAEIEAVNPAMAVVHNQNDEFVGTVEVMDMDEDPDGVEVFINDEQMNEISSTHLYEDDRFWEDYDAETFNAMSEQEKADRRFNRARLKAIQKFADNPDNEPLVLRWVARDLLFIYVHYFDVENGIVVYSPSNQEFVRPAFRELEVSGKIAKRNLDRFQRFQDPARGMAFWGYSYKDENGQQQTYSSAAMENSKAAREFMTEVYRGRVTLPSSVKDEIPAILEIRRKGNREQLADVRKRQKALLEGNKETLAKNQDGAEEMAQMMLGEKTIYSYPKAEVRNEALRKNPMAIPKEFNATPVPYICTTYTCRTEIGGTHKGSDAMRFLAFLNEVKRRAKISNISYEHIGDEGAFGVVVFKFDVCGYGKKPNITHLKGYLEGLREGLILRGADYEDLHRPIQTLAEGDEPNEEWYMEAETFNAMSFKQWSEDEMNEELHGGQNMDFDSWLNDEIRTHGNIPLREWGYEEEHDEPEHQHAESMMSKRGKVRTLSGKPHKARKLKKDRDITPEEAKTRLSFRARKGIDTYAEPFEEIGEFYSGAKGILKIVGLGALVSVGVWITKNKLLE